MMNDEPKQNILIKILLISIFSCGLVWLSYFTKRSDFIPLICLYSVFFAVYLLLIKYFKNTRETIFVGVFFRLLLLFSIPNLSDDFYRFVWDGRLLANGINPYLILPSEFIDSPDFQAIIDDKTLFQNLNSPNYYTVYPPINQLIFGISAWFSGKNLFLNIIWLRSFILIGELISLVLIKKIFEKNVPFCEEKSQKQSSTSIAFYAFNPLIIIELTGNLHFEALVICFLLVSVWLFQKNLSTFSAMAFGMAVGVKLLPLIFIPLIIKHLQLKRGIVFSCIVAFFMIIIFSFFVDKLLITKISSSISLYFQKFEFNASIYYLVREVGYWIQGYNIIGTAGKILALVSFGSILWISYKSKEFFSSALFVLSIYLAFATTVHSWYISTLIGIAIFTPFRFPIVWSFFVFLSYATYQTSAYQENLFLVILEYVCVYGFAFYELKQHKYEAFSRTLRV